MTGMLSQADLERLVGYRGLTPVFVLMLIIFATWNDLIHLKFL